MFGHLRDRRRADGWWRAGPVAGHGLRLRKLRLTPCPAPPARGSSLPGRALSLPSRSAGVTAFRGRSSRAGLVRPLLRRSVVAAVVCLRLGEPTGAPASARQPIPAGGAYSHLEPDCCRRTEAGASTMVGRDRPRGAPQKSLARTRGPRRYGKANDVGQGARPRVQPCLHPPAVGLAASIPGVTVRPPWQRPQSRDVGDGCSVPGNRVNRKAPTRYARDTASMSSMQDSRSFSSRS